ncbi:hypothetical protein KW785_02025 [Candidatus Parcubacteria bacterium]|nr:hypothetical protein [Candidatus Parcubacteria bacterium]
MPRKKPLQPERTPVAVGLHDRSTFLILREKGSKEERLVLARSRDGKKFSKVFQPVLLRYGNGKREDISKCRDLKIFSEKGLSMTYVLGEGSSARLVYATARSPRAWTVKGSVKIGAPGIFVPELTSKAGSAVYYGRDVLRVATSKTGKSWRTPGEQRAPYWRFFDGLPFHLAGVHTTDEGTFVICGSCVTEEILQDVNRAHKVGEVEMCRLGVALFRRDQPGELAWQTELPFMDVPLRGKSSFGLLGVVTITRKKERLVRVYMHFGDEVGLFEFPSTALSRRHAYMPILLAKATGNPIISPGRMLWERQSAFNPAALRIGDNVHILYRAIGADGVSRLGYASSPDGVRVEGHMETPAFALQDPRKGKIRRYNPVMYPSGGSWGGTEDPRMVMIERQVYVTFNMFDGWDRLRVAVVWIDLEDFLQKKFWKWSKPVLLSPEGQVHKNWILFPEKINGKFALLHNLHDDDLERVRIEYVDDLASYQAPSELASPDPNAIPDRPTSWHKRMRSAGPPPLKTSEGWLLFYHATDRYEPKRYKLGVMLLDLSDPTKILHRASASVLNPDEFYENNGKPGIVYACGAVEIDDTIHVYYGGADKVACVATVKTEELLRHIIKGEDTRFSVSKVTL